MIELNDLNLQPAATHGSSSYLIFKPAVSLSTVLTKKMASQKIAKIALLILGCIAVLQAESTPKTADGQNLLKITLSFDHYNGSEAEFYLGGERVYSVKLTCGFNGITGTFYDHY